MKLTSLKLSKRQKHNVLKVSIASISDILWLKKDRICLEKIWTQKKFAKQILLSPWRSMYLGLHPPCWELHAGLESISFPHRLSYYSSLIIFYTSTSLNSWGGYFFVCENSRFKSFGHPMLLHSTRYYIPLQCSWYPKWHFPCLLCLSEIKSPS